MPPPEAGPSYEPQKPSRERREAIPISVNPLAEISADLGDVEAQIAQAQKSIADRFGLKAGMPLGYEEQQRGRQKAEAALEPLLARRQELKTVREAALRGDMEALRSHYDQDVARGEKVLEDRANALAEGMEVLRQERPQVIEAHLSLESSIANFERLAQVDPHMGPGLKQALPGMREALGNSEVSRLRRPVVDAQNKLDRKLETRAAIGK